MEENHHWISWTPNFVRFGGAMKKLKGLVCLVLGLLMLVLWGALVTYMNYEFYVAPTKSVFTVLMPSLYIAFVGGPLSNVLFPTNLWPFTGFALTFIGIYRLVRSRRESRS